MQEDNTEENDLLRIVISDIRARVEEDLGKN